MRRAFLGFVFALFTIASTSHADEHTPATRVEDAAFSELARAGDNARAAGRLSDAVRAYRAALDLKNDAVIAGRLGLVAFEGGAIALSVDFLLRGITDGQKASLAERRQVKDAYDRARSLVCRVNVSVSNSTAEVSIDGEPQPWATSKGEFYVFVLPGRHTVRARLDGYEDATEIIDAPKGEELPVRLTLSPLKEKPESVPTPSPEPPPTPAPTIAKETPAPIQATQATQTSAPLKRDDSTIKTSSPWSVGAGPVVVVGAVSQWPAFGFVGSIDLKIGEVASLRLDARGASSPYLLKEWPIRGWTMGILPALCARRSLYFGCVQAHLGAIGHDTNTASPPPSSVWKIRGGIGASLGLEPQIQGPWHVRIAGDLLLFQDETPVRAFADVSGKPPIWTGLPVLAGLSVIVVWRHGTR